MRYGQRTRVTTQVSGWLPRGAFSPIELSPRVWFDASDASTITSSSGAVSQWNDKSGNNYHLAQGNAANQPGTGTTTQNGLNVITFDGSNDFIRNANDPALVNLPVTIVVVAKENASSTGTRGMVNTAAYNQNGTAMIVQDSGSARQFVMFTNAFRTGPIVTSTNVQIYLSVVTSADVYLEAGTRSATPANTTTQRAAGFTVGSNINGTGEFWRGWIGEVLHFEKELSAVERKNVTDYLNAKWAVY